MKLNIWSGVAPSEASDKGVGNGSSWLFYVPHVFTTHTGYILNVTLLFIFC